MNVLNLLEVLFAILLLIDDDDVVTDETRFLGMVIARGTQVVAITPVEGAEKLKENPFK